MGALGCTIFIFGAFGLAWLGTGSFWLGVLAGLFMAALPIGEP